MKIAFYHNLTSGGSKREAYEFARQCVRAGHLVDSYAPSTGDEAYLSLDSVVHHSYRFDLAFLAPWHGRLPFLRRYVDLVCYWVNLKRLDQVAQTIARQIDAGAYDWVLAHHDLIVQGPYVLRYLKTPTAYYCAEVNRGVYELPVIRPYDQSHSRSERIRQTWYGPANWLMRQLLKREDRLNVLSAYMHLTNSFFTAEALQRAYGIHARVSYLGADTDKFLPLDLERENFVLSVGAITPLKGYDFLVGALGQMAALDRPKLVLVGNVASTPEKNYLNELAKSNGVSITFHVNTSDMQLAQLYNRALAFVYAPVLEPFGLAPLEAMACETPVVAVREGGVRESVLDGVTGYLTTREPKAFAEALTCFVRDPVRAREFGKRGREHVLRYWTWGYAYERLMVNLQNGSMPV